MLRNLKKGNAELKSGIFIMVTLGLLIFSILWLRYFAILPDKKIIVRFKNPGPIDSGLPVYFQGINVGKIKKVGFSPDYRCTYVYIDIYMKKLQLPANMKAKVKVEGIAGQKYVSLMYPENPSGELLADGSMIEGETPLGLDDIKEFFRREIDNGRLPRLFNNMEAAIVNANAATAEIGKTSQRLNMLMAKYDSDIDNIVSSTSGTISGLNKTIKDVNQVVASAEIQDGLRDTVKNINKLVETTNTRTENVFNQIDQASLIPNINATVYKTYTTLNETQSAIQTARQTALTYDCVGKNINDVLNQRFLLFKLMFGRVGKPLEKCETVGSKP